MTIPPDICRCLEQYFDKILVVSIPRLVERHKKIAKNLEGLSFEMFWGVDHQTLDMEQLKQNGIYNEKTTLKVNRYIMALRPGEIACSLSHRMLYETMIREQWNKVLVLEDDVIPLTDNMKKIPEMLTELPEDWELVYFGYLRHEKVTNRMRVKQFFYKISSSVGLMKWSYKMVNNLFPKPYTKHLKKAGFHDCTHAYALTLPGAEKLVKAQTPVVHTADDLFSYLVMNGKLNAFVTEPKFFDQEIFHDKSETSEVQVVKKVKAT